MGGTIRDSKHKNGFVSDGWGSVCFNELQKADEEDCNSLQQKHGPRESMAQDQECLK